MDSSRSQYSSGLTTGATPTTIKGTDDLDYTIIKLEVAVPNSGNYCHRCIYSKITISGFPNCVPGINLSIANIKGDGVGKFYGTVQKADVSVVSGSNSCGR